MPNKKYCLGPLSLILFLLMLKEDQKSHRKMDNLQIWEVNPPIEESFLSTKS